MESVLVLPALDARPFWGPPTTDERIENLPPQLVQRFGTLNAAVDWTKIEPKDTFTVARDNAQDSAIRSLLTREGMMHRGRGGRGSARGRGGARGGPSGSRGRYAGQRGKKHFTQRTEIVYAKDTLLRRHDSEAIASFTTQELIKSRTVHQIPQASDLRVCGRPHIYEASIDEATTQCRVRLVEKESATPNQTTDDFVYCPLIEDRMIRTITKECAGEKPVVVTTDEVLATLMAASRSMHSWHVRFVRANRFVFLDRDPNNEGGTDLQWVAETNVIDGPTETTADPMNRITSLGLESTKCHLSFRGQVRSKKVLEIKSDRVPEALQKGVMYRYRKWTLHPGTEHEYDVVCRCEIDAALPNSNDLVRAFGLLEYIPPSPTKTWATSLDQQRAATTVSEFKANSCKFIKWVAASILSGAKWMKIGFISRAPVLQSVSDTREDKPGSTHAHQLVRTSYDSNMHNIVGVESRDPVRFAYEVGVHVTGLWSTANLFIETFLNSGQREAYLLKYAGNDKFEMFVQGVDEEFEDSEEDEEDDSGEDGADDGGN
jgi:translation initiation factor 3 subunit D